MGILRKKKRESNNEEDESGDSSSSSSRSSNSSISREAVNANRHNSKRNLEKFKSFCTKLTTFFFSRVGLCFVVVAYVAFGGLVFKSIEGAYEEEKAQNKTLINDVVNYKTENLIHEIWNMTKFELVFHEKNYTNKLKNKLVDYQKNLTDAIKEGYKGPSHQNLTKWTYPGSILYAVTIVTTIGYGHITCETDAGKIATIVYAIVGIPMMLLCLANIGSSMANFFRFLYARVCCGYCNYVRKRNIRLKAATLSSVAVNHANAISYAALATTNFATNNQNGAQNDDNQTPQYNMNSPSPLSPPLNILMEEKSKLKIQDIKLDGISHAGVSSPANLLDLFEENNAVDYKKITVPISITLFILSSYILLGGILFKTLEQWTILEGVYFCFITLSTIGLGDYVPGNSINDTDTQSEFKLVGCSMYLLMGLSLIAMCFNLMQEEVTAKFRRLAVRLGIIDDPNYW